MCIDPEISLYRDTYVTWGYAYMGCRCSCLACINYSEKLNIELFGCSFIRKLVVCRKWSSVVKLCFACCKSFMLFSCILVVCFSILSNNVTLLSLCDMYVLKLWQLRSTLHNAFFEMSDSVELFVAFAGFRILLIADKEFMWPSTLGSLLKELPSSCGLFNFNLASWKCAIGWTTAGFSWTGFVCESFINSAVTEPNGKRHLLSSFFSRMK